MTALTSSPPAADADRAEELTGIIRSYNEVTERLKQSHELLRREVCRLRDELQEKNRELQRRERLAALGQMAAGVAHEIRNPLGGIRLYASLLERDLVDQPDQLQIANHIGAGVERMERIVGDVLAFAGDRAPRRQVVRLAEVIENALLQTAAQIQESGTEIEVDASLYEVNLSCDADQIEGVFVNLILNAVQATGPGGRIWIRPAEGNASSKSVLIAVEDDGPGIAPAIAHRIFNPFFTTREVGTGLGLAIVHRIVEAHGGSISVRNRSGGGASLVMTMPLAEELLTENVG